MEITQAQLVALANLDVSSRATAVWRVPATGQIVVHCRYGIDIDILMDGSVWGTYIEPKGVKK